MRFEVLHRFPCTDEQLWSIIMDPAYQSEVDKAAGLTRTVLEERTTADGPFRRIRVEPDAKLPAAAQKIFGSSKLVYVQEQRWKKRDRSMKWRVVLDRAADRVRCSGDFRVSARAGGECERRVTGEVVVSVPLVGKRIEGRIVESLKESYERTAGVTRTWISERL